MFNKIKNSIKMKSIMVLIDEILMATILTFLNLFDN